MAGGAAVSSVSSSGWYNPLFLISAETAAKCLDCNTLGPSSLQRAHIKGILGARPAVLFALRAAMLSAVVKDRSVAGVVGREIIYFIRAVDMAGKCCRHNVLFSNLCPCTCFFYPPLLHQLVQ